MNNKRLLIAAAAMLAIALPATAARPKLPQEWNELVGTFDGLLEQDRIVGGSVAYVENGRMVTRHDYGFADEKTGKRVDGDTIFHWASISKTLNAIGFMQLRDRGLVSLDESIAGRVPELRKIHDPFGPMDDIKIYMLLEHSAGFQGPTWPYKQNKPWEPFEPTTWEQLVAMMPYQEISFVPGSKFSYSNPAWIYLARVVQDVTGDPWEYYIQKNIFTPLGMTRSYFGYSPYHLQEYRSQRYAVENDAGGKVVVKADSGEFNPGITIPNGGWNSPLEDAVTYIAFLTNATGGDAKKQRLYDTVLKRSTLEEMWKPRLPVNGRTPDEHMGLAYFIIKRGSQRIVGHTGGQGGFSSMIYCNPDTGRGVVAAFNTSNSEKKSFQKIQAQAFKVLQ